MSKKQYEVVYDILSCRTAYLGGHVEKCDHCGRERPAYNSCRNRHCPKCQSLTKERWLQARKAELLTVIYFHSVFTLPHELNAVILSNKKLMLTILFKATSPTLQTFGQNPDNGLGGKIGFICFLLVGASEKLGTITGFNQLKAKLWAKTWVVDIEEPIDRPENVLEYVGRHTHRVAISNDRIISLKDTG